MGRCGYTVPTLLGWILGLWLSACEAGTIGAGLQGEIVADPTQAVADGRPGVQVTVRLWRAGAPGSSVAGQLVELVSMRNAAGAQVDTIEQPSLPTDADGRAVAFVGSLEVGQVELRATVGGALLCASGRGADCSPATASVEFVLACPEGQTDCDGACVDLETDSEHCGRCDRVCAFDNAAADCLNAECVMGDCLAGAGDCNGWEGDGCETDTDVSAAHCGGCNRPCGAGEVCRDGGCVYECHDVDGDGHDDAICGGDDCDDSLASVYPGAPEVCDNSLDDDCDSAIDAADLDCIVCAQDADCDDGDPCNGAESCPAGFCRNGQALDCDDANECTYDICQAGSGCEHLNHTEPCDDGDACTMDDRCAGGTCQGRPLDADGDSYVADSCGGLDCDDGDPLINPGQSESGALCTNTLDDDCDGDTDGDDRGCQACTIDDDCDDGNACNGAETCPAGQCQNGTPPNCDDTNPCTDDSCDPASGCTHVANTAPCDDGDACTQVDVCSAGVCTGTIPRDCGDGNPCTDDGCDPASGCTHVDNTDPCEDGDACNGAEVCAGGSCQAGTSLDCDDGNGCTEDSCIPASGCAHADNTAACNDGNACTVGDVCGGGACQPGAARDCDDGNGCTDDSCVPASGCTYSNNHVACNDGNACTEGDVCGGGACQPGAARNCDDDNVCTDDSCVPATGCVATNNTNPCDDTDPCTEADACAGGSCTGAPLDADDDGFVAVECGGDDCQDGNPQVNPGIFEGPEGAAVCDDGIDNDCDLLIDLQEDTCGDCFDDADCLDTTVCNGQETCVTGSCVAGTPLSCGDGNPCTDDSCDPVSGCQHVNNSANCDDGNPCTVNDHCAGGSCQGGGAATCDDGLACTDDSCDPASGCVFTIDDTNTCDDSSDCTTGDHCSGGVCVGSIRDRDGDNYPDEICGGTDCDDLDPAIHPGATEVCDGADDDCDDRIDQRLCDNQQGACAGAWQQCVSGTWAPCDYSSQTGFSWVETGTADSVDNDCDGCTDEGSAGYSAPLVAVEVKPHDGGNGLRRLYGNGQFGPVGAVLPVPLTVQLNNGSGVPQVGQLVSFAVQAAGTVCYGQGGTFSPTNGLSPVTILQVCNDATDAQVLSPAQVHTDEHGQASVLLRLGAHQGLVAVRATAGSNTVDFFAVPVTTLNTSIVVPTATTTSNTNPALGPLNVTARPTSQGSAAYLGNLNNYTLAITGLSASTGASADGVAQAPLVSGGSLTISGANFSTSGNQVWLGGVSVAVTGENAGTITVTIPEGIPGATAVVVNDGTTTGFTGGSGNIPSVATAVANFWRLAAKPVFVFAATGTRPATTAQVRLVGLDECGNPLSLSGRTLALQAVNPDGTTSGVSVGVGMPNGTTGLATVTPVGTTRRAAVVRGTIDGVSSDALVDGNTTVTTVPNLLGPGNFVHDPGLGNNNGINSMILRGGDEDPSTTASQLNPAFRFTSAQVASYTVPNGSGAVYGTECQLAAANMTGQGDVRNTPVSGTSAMAGTGLYVVSGGSAGLQAVVSARIAYDVSGTGSTDVNATAMSGWLRQDTSEQEFEFNSSSLMYYDNNEHRNIVMRILLQRSLP